PRRGVRISACPPRPARLLSINGSRWKRSRPEVVMRPQVAALFTLALLSLALPTYAGDDKKTTDVEVSRTAIFTETNQLRAKQKARALKRNAKLDEAAQKHVENLARQDKLGDKGNPHILDGKDMRDRVMAVGYRARLMGENIAFQFDAKTPKKTAAAVVAGWE